MKRYEIWKMLRPIQNYLVFFLTVAFAVSCCMMLFVTTLAESMGLVFNEINIAAAAKLTFGNVLLITLLFSTTDYIRRKITVDRPVRIITEATEKIMQGDFRCRQTTGTADHQHSQAEPIGKSADIPTGRGI